MAKASLFDDYELTDEEKFVRHVNGFSIGKLTQMVDDYCGGHRLVWSKEAQPYPGSAPTPQGQIPGFRFDFSPEERMAVLNEAGTAADLFIFSYKWKAFLEDLMNALPARHKKKYLDPRIRPGDLSSLQKDSVGKYVLPGVPEGYQAGQPDSAAGTVSFEKVPEAAEE